MEDVLVQVRDVDPLHSQTSERAAARWHLDVAPVGFVPGRTMWTFPSEEENPGFLSSKEVNFGEFPFCTASAWGRDRELGDDGARGQGW